MISTDTSTDIVQGEVELMQSAFGPDFEDLREDYEKSKKPPDVRMTLGPHHSMAGAMDKTISVIIRIQAHKNYPEQPAVIKVESYSGITSEDSKLLFNNLNNLAITLAKTSEVVMLQVAEFTQDFLAEKQKECCDTKENTDLLKQKTTLIEEREWTKEKLKQEMQHRKELSKVTFLLQSENRDTGFVNQCICLHKCLRSSFETSELSKSDFIQYDFLFPVKGKFEKPVTILDTVFKNQGSLLLVCSLKSQDTSELCFIRHWCTRKRKLSCTGLNYDTESLISKLNSFCKEMNSFFHLSCQNILPYYGLKVESTPDRIYVNIMQKYIFGLTLSYYIDQELPLNDTLIKHYAKGTLNGLHYLHKNDIVHGDLSDTCIYVDKATSNVVISDYSIPHKVMEAISEYRNESSSHIYPLSPGKGGKNGDIYRIGLIFLSLSLGYRVQKVVPAIPFDISSEFSSFLGVCLQVKEQLRATVEQLLEHNFIASESQSEENKDSGLSEVVCKENSLSENASQSLPLISKFMRGISRLTTDFRVLEKLGEGGFGDVYQVRNLVDDSVYALKRISLHHKNDKIKRKIIREVKLLSSLNHDHVVRYYTSWIETENQSDSEEDASESTNDTENKKDENLSLLKTANHQHFLDNMSFSKGRISKNSCLNDVSGKFSDAWLSGIDEDDSSEEDDWISGAPKGLHQDKNSDNVIFFESNPNFVNNETESVSGLEQHKVSLKVVQFLYIQMEFCENKTLREAIEGGLYLDQDRMWRLFYEIVSGLDYIHSQGLIHRDLKPGNIFLNLSDHIKIGDFGLATAPVRAVYIPEVSDSKDTSVTTGQVGTAMYIAPEISASPGKVNYTSKVDIFSLGIIFFEMNYRPAKTAMERYKIISNLRKNYIEFPSDFLANDKTLKLILHFLKNDPLSRPSAKDVLRDTLPPPETAEEKKFITKLEDRIRNPETDGYNDLISRLFSADNPQKLEARFDVNQKELVGFWYFWNFDRIKSLIIQIFKIHGGLWISTPFYVPKGTFYKEESIVDVMLCRGELVSAQFELRYPFARLISRSNVKRIRRFNIDKVQRLRTRIPGIHPREIYECAFDIIAPMKEVSETCARAMLVAYDTIKILSNFDVTICISHLDLVKAILQYSGIVDDAVLSNVLLNLKAYWTYHLTVDELVENLLTCNINYSAIDFIKFILTVDGNFNDIMSVFNARNVLKRKGLKKNVFSYMTFLEDVIKKSKILGIQFNICICPLMVTDYKLYCGFICQFIFQAKQQNPFILARGGTFEHLINNHRNLYVDCVHMVHSDQQLAVGISLSMEKFLIKSDASYDALIGDYGKCMEQIKGLGCGGSVVIVLICAIQQNLLEQRIFLCSTLRKAGIAADHYAVENIEEAKLLAEEMKVPNLIAIFDNNVAQLELSEKISDYGERSVKLPILEVGDVLIKKINSYESSSYGINSGSSKNEMIKPLDFDIKFEQLIKKLPKNKTLQKIEQQIYLTLKTRWTNLVSSSTVDVIITDLEKRLMLSLGELDFDSNSRSFNESVEDLKNRFPSQKDIIMQIAKFLEKKIFVKKKSTNQCCIIVYSILTDGMKRLV